jgi:hypothetical protein
MTTLLELANKDRLDHEKYIPVKEWENDRGEMGLYTIPAFNRLYGLFMHGEALIYMIEWDDLGRESDAIDTMQSLADFSDAYEVSDT